MANTYKLIASTTLSSTSSSIVLSSIPQTFTDLVLKWNARTTVGVVDNYIQFVFNGTQAYSTTIVSGTGGAIPSSYATANGTSYMYIENGYTGTTATANVFASGELYIPNYKLAEAKQMYSYVAAGTNTTTGARTSINAGLLRSADAINTITINGATFEVGSSFSIYGISSS
jgi:hypothetical protein